MAQRLAERGCIPDRILCSSAVRTQETAHYFSEHWGLADDAIVTCADLYLASPTSLLSVLQQLGTDSSHTMIIAHNPGLEDLSALLSPACVSPMPTLGIRHFQYRADMNISRVAANQDSSTGTSFGSTDSSSDSQNDPAGEPEGGTGIAFLFEDYPKNL